MKVLVLGGGIIGVTTAYELRRNGHEVTVLDAHEAVAQETSFANAGLIAPGHAYAWAAPEAPRILLRSLWRNDQALRMRFSADPKFWAWCLKFLGQCSAENFLRNTRIKHRLCLYSQAALSEVVGDTEVTYDSNKKGLLYLYRKAKPFEEACSRTTMLTEAGQEIQAIGREDIARLDPALAPVKESFAGALYCPSDESGDARKFTEGLAKVAADRGVEFRFKTTIRRLEAERDRVTAVVTDEGPMKADLYVMALGSYSAPMARKIGVKLPIYPVKGYSVTFPIPEGTGHNPPQLGGVDQDHLVAYCRLGDRLRVTATAEFAGYNTSHSPKDYLPMLKVARELLPKAADYEQPNYWACLRPMTPGGPPLFGLARHRNLYYNVGHGAMGWTMACGAARITADLIAGLKPEIDLTGMTLR